MKFGLRVPSLRKRIAARTSWKRYLRHSLGLKAPRGWGWLTNPRKAAYNRIYRRTTFSIEDLLHAVVALFRADRRPDRSHAEPTLTEEQWARDRERILGADGPPQPS